MRAFAYKIPKVKIKRIQSWQKSSCPGSAQSAKVYPTQRKMQVQKAVILETFRLESEYEFPVCKLPCYQDMHNFDKK